MGFDKHFYEDHCYLDDPADGVGMNVEIIEENYQDNNIILEKPAIRYLDMSGSSSSTMNNSCEDNIKPSKRALVYLPYSEYCTDHKGLFLHEDEKLVKPGDKFGSHDDFVQYLNENAKRWCFYYRCSDSRKPNTGYETYTYNCVYLRNKEKYKKKGLRKRNNNMKTDCPCKIKLRHLPNERELTVVYVCNHHDHELSMESFYKLQHGRRLPPYVKEEIKDFLQLKVDIMKIKAYVEMETGFNMSRPFFYTLEKNMKSRYAERHISEQRLKLLQQKIAAVDEMYGFNEDENVDEQQQVEYHAENAKEIHKKIKQRRLIVNADQARRTPPLKRRSKGNQETSFDGSKRIKIEEHTENYSNETLQSVKHLQESVKCEIQKNPWIADQCVPVLPNRTATISNCAESIQTLEDLPEGLHLLVQNDCENFSYTIEYYSPDESNHQDIINELGEIINDGQVIKVGDNNIDNIAYETVVTEDTDETQNEVEEYVDHDQTMEESVEMQIDSQEHVINESEILDEDIITQDIVEEENHVEYITEEGDENEGEVEYLEEEFNEENCAQEIGVQTADDTGTAHALLPVFDVYMKDGNVTGFVVSDNLINGLKDGVDKEIQTNEDLIIRDTKKNYDGEIIHEPTNSKLGETYTKHEYVHKYNIEKYMVQPHFPKYIETLAKETYMDVLQMFTNIYHEKAMFKITTTQKGKEGNTRIWYVKDSHRTKRSRKNLSQREKLGQNLQSIFLLKEKLRYMKKKNNELIIKNKQLEEVALRLVEMS